MKNLEMRQVMEQVLEELMQKDDRIVVLDADLAKAVGTTKLHQLFPERTLQAGIAEADMVSVAAGLAAYGFIPLTFTFAAFSSRRVCDQVALSVCFAQKAVKLFGGDPGITAQVNGATHMGLDDIGTLRSIPGLMIFEPSDLTMMRKLLPEVIYNGKPVYIRLLRKGAPEIYDEDAEFDLMRIEKLRDGSDVTLAASGIMVAAARDAALLLASEGISAEVLDVHTIKPLDEATLLASVRKTGAVVTCDNHNVIGGVGSAVAEATARNHPVPIEFIGTQDHFGEAADQAYLAKKYHMTAEDIAAAAKRAMARK
ncbi:MAG: transketolase family protein [Oscillospiraceae bacterium]